MLDQMNLFGSDDEPPRDSGHAAKTPRGPRKPHKLFFAILPDAQAAQELSALGASLDQRYGIGGRPLRPDRLHVTLHVIGEYDETPEADVLAARQAGDAMHEAAFDVVFDRAMTFVAARAYVLGGGEGVEAVKAFWLKLGIQLANANLRAIKHSTFTPHMTLSYQGRPVAEHPIEPVRWTAREFVLIDSHVGKTIHDVKARWPLKV